MNYAYTVCDLCGFSSNGIAVSDARYRNFYRLSFGEIGATPGVVVDVCQECSYVCYPKAIVELRGWLKELAQPAT